MRYGEVMTPALNGIWKGVLVALVNVVAIGFGLAISESDQAIVPLVMVFGTIPAVFLGGVLGLLGGATERLSMWLRLALLLGPALSLVYILGDEFSMREYIPHAMIMSGVAVSVLERWTRWREVPPLPVAHVA